MNRRGRAPSYKRENLEIKDKERYCIFLTCKFVGYKFN